MKKLLTLLLLLATPAFADWDYVLSDGTDLTIRKSGVTNILGPISGLTNSGTGASGVTNIGDLADVYFPKSVTNANASMMYQNNLRLFVPSSYLPLSISNTAASGRTPTGAAANGVLLSEGLGNCTIYSYWGATDATTNAAAWSNVVSWSGVSTGAFSTNVASTWTTRYYRSFVSNFNKAAETAWAPSSITVSPYSSIRLTINPGRVAADLSSFPVLVKLSTSCGVSNYNASALFTEITTNSQKVMITDAALAGPDGHYWCPECQVEWRRLSHSDDETPTLAWHNYKTAGVVL